MKSAHEQSRTDIRVVLASGSRFFLRGLCGILEDTSGINVVAQASSCKEVEEYLIKTEADFLFIDNLTLKLDIHMISELVSKVTPPPKVICLGDKCTGAGGFPNIKNLTKEADSSELIKIIKGNNVSRSSPTRGGGKTR